MRNNGFSLIELTLCLTLIVGLGALTYKLFSPSASLAAIRHEQQQAGQIVQSLTDLYVLQPSYAGLSTDTLNSTYNSKFRIENGSVATPSSIAQMAVVQAGTAFGANDSIDLIYMAAPTGSCIKLGTALAKSADFVRINGFQVQKPYSSLHEANLATQCATRDRNEVLFRYTNKNVSTQATDMLACECSPTIETQTLACPANASGSITQRRNATCSASTCPTRQWTSWVTTSNTCGANGAPIPTVPVVALGRTCFPNVEQRVTNCPAGQIGFVIERRSMACPSEQWGNWTTATTTCAAPLPATPQCKYDPVTDKETRTTSCEPGQGGNITQERFRNCNSSGTKDWSEWKTLNTTCSASCVTTGTCCSPGRMQRAASVGCPINTYGQRDGIEEQFSRCASATTTPIWSGTWSLKGSSVVGSCNACPPNTSEVLSRTEPRSGSCPAGTYGNQSWEAVFNQTVNISYACNASANQTSPGRSESYSNWVESGTRNHNSNCTACPGAYNETEEQWVRVDNGCPNGYSGQNGFEKQQHRQRTISFSCPSSQTTPPSPNVGAWGGWYDTGAQRNHVNSCAASCTVENRSYRVAWQNSSALNGLKDCNASNIGQRSWSNYTSCSGMGPCGGTFRAAICTASGWQIVAGAGSSPYVGWASGRPAEWDAVYMQGYNDAPAIGAQQGSAGQSNWITYQCL
ncbi:type II secretion system protein [Stenotrophomonas sp. S39]|uniref:type II secretion system protein n=1 Tax=Stenotrophomonas sp. S39 TaxID=2767451 RepID=UPI00190AFDD1|nr:type II secretion system protein [Stenotrophomonas sp. S39]MBK0052933.1 type II secretion system protein [Stenotrophomonas sp. S39]